MTTPDSAASATAGSQAAPASPAASQSVPSPASGDLVPAALALARREVLRFLRQPTRLAGTVGQPLLFWLVLGFGLSPSFQAAGMEGVSYTEYIYPGILMMMVLFAGVFATITVIEDRDQGILQGVLVAPVTRLSIVLGKVLGATVIALIQAGVLLLAAPVMGYSTGPVGYLFIVATLAVLSVGCTGLGFFIAWGIRSTSGYHALMMLVMMPMWFLSSALFPVAGAPWALQAVMWVNPFTHGMMVLRAPFYESPLGFLTDPAYWGSWLVVALWLGLVLWGSARRVAGRESGAALKLKPGPAETRA